MIEGLCRFTAFLQRAAGDDGIGKVCIVGLDKPKRLYDKRMVLDHKPSRVKQPVYGKCHMLPIKSVLRPEGPIKLKQTDEGDKSGITSSEAFPKFERCCPLRRVVIDDEPQDDIRVEPKNGHAAASASLSSCVSTAFAPPASSTAASISSSVARPFGGFQGAPRDR
ncbi:hypothetical protein NOJ17_12540 [Neorhizobium galegae]|nr:hypothetical protein [Neorhizobium galegae]UIY31279.1 hypothetical protein LZK73_17775 [Neorhizobium galegae]